MPSPCYADVAELQTKVTTVQSEFRDQIMSADPAPHRAGNPFSCGYSSITEIAPTYMPDQSASQPSRPDTTASSYPDSAAS